MYCMYMVTAAGVYPVGGGGGFHPKLNNSSCSANCYKEGTTCVSKLIWNGLKWPAIPPFIKPKNSNFACMGKHIPRPP